ncbi:MAG TPA: transketolase [Candidatus Nanoarchaeia archaeon]|nr:transketolase [Candidatus Nanoarchaeia archaeon]
MNSTQTLEQKAKKIRKDILDMSMKYNDGHIAPSFSIVEILVALYFRILKENDKLILSKGHSCLALYTALMELGYCPTISGHPDIQVCEGIHCTTGSLGHGLPIGVGMAFAKKLKKEKGHVYVVMGDGECQEGTIWESMNLAQRYKLDNLTAIIDFNKFQALTTIKDVMNETEHSLKSKFKAFGCNVIMSAGHNVKELADKLGSKTIVKDTPRVIIADTVKGKGISFMENDPKWHSRLPKGDELKQAYEELR